MKIGFDAKRAFCNHRGLGNYSRNLIEGLGKFYPENQYFLYTPKYSSAPVKNWSIPQKTSIREPRGLLKFVPSLWRGFYLSKDIFSNGLDIYHGLSHELPWGIEKSNARSIVTIHDLIAFRFPHLFPWLDRQIYMKKMAYSCQKADLVVAICEQTKRDIQEFLNISAEKIKTLYQSIHPRFYDPPEKSSIEKVLAKWKITFPYILFVGALEERKNVLTLVKAYSSIKQSKEYGLILVGRGGYYQKKVKELIGELGLSEKVKILSQVESCELPCLYTGSTLFCYPSLFEGFGLPVAEALFCGKPVIVSQGSSFPEVGGEGSIYINPHNKDSLINALEMVLEDEDKQSEMSRMGKEHVKKFHWQKTTENLIQVYKDMAGR